MTPDILCSFPCGYNSNFLLAGWLKRELQDETLEPAQRLEMLEQLNSLTHQLFDEDVLRAIEPMSDVEYSMFLELMKVSPGDNKKATFDLMRREDVFGKFRSVNPSYDLSMRTRR